MNEHQSLLNDLLMTRQFREAIDAALAGDIAYLSSSLRAAARAGETISAAFVEGRIEALEGVVGVLERYVARAQK